MVSSARRLLTQLLYGMNYQFNSPKRILSQLKFNLKVNEKGKKVICFFMVLVLCLLTSLLSLALGVDMDTKYRQLSFNQPN